MVQSYTVCPDPHYFVYELHVLTPFLIYATLRAFTAIKFLTKNKSPN